jgi:hypothetical protein
MRRGQRSVVSQKSHETRLAYYHSSARARSPRRGVPLNTRARNSQRNARLPFVPPENWYEPVGEATDYRFVVQSPGEGFRHILTPDEVRDRLAALPKKFVAPLEVVQLSRMTRKKQSFPCYGMQWGTCIYLYPIEESLVEYYHRPPRPSQYTEAILYGGRWEEDADGWRLIWSESAIKDFYLNNILVHELGHLLDERNTSYTDRERYAEWFAIQYGYLPTQAERRPSRQLEQRRRHAKK